MEPSLPGCRQTGPSHRKIQTTPEGAGKSYSLSVHNSISTIIARILFCYVFGILFATGMWLFGFNQEERRMLKIGGNKK
ncbi:MAG: hypothetical protein IJ343_09450 [Clostridia bacterium]|nr:hypothetical protein [Clostridia bacterium]